MKKERAAAVYKMGLPEADDVQQKVPYIHCKVPNRDGRQEKQANQRKTAAK